MSEMVERVGRAICTAHGLDPESSRSLAWNVRGVPGSSYFAKGWMAYEQDARAAIAAMREPTEAMHTAAEAEYMCRSEDVYPIWNAMIDAALK